MPADMSRPFSKIVGYVRVSTRSQGVSGLGLEAQRAAIEGYARSIGVPVAMIFEEVESGKRTNRPQLAAAIRMCSLTGAALVAARVDRFGRRAGPLFALRDARFPVIACDMPHADSFVWGVLALMAEKEGRSISERTVAALAAAKARGTKLGGKAESLSNREVGSARGVAVRKAKADTRAAELAPIIADLRASGAASLGELAAGLNAAGVPTARGGEWSAVQVQRVLARLALAA
jgi:DNA invertase Pin-like site-specific DNA recombinase